SKRRYMNIRNLIAIIIIIALILLLGFININKISENRKQDLYEKLVDIIESAGKDYIDKHVTEADGFTESTDTTACIWLSTLIDESLLESDNLINPTNNHDMTGNYIRITNSGGLSYEYVDSDTPTNCDRMIPQP
ncbi:MAG TPA: hypothetical protein PKY25_03600, partial [Bacilli bacterium]|nr:hypothetical protein [Bacilli bacterium]